MINIYTDGSCEGNGKVENIGGIGIVILNNENTIKEISKTFKNTTNNKMELLAIIESLIYCLTNNLQDEEIVVFSDSQYCINGITDWVNKWEKQGYSKKGGLANSDIWFVLHSLKKSFKYLSFQWVRGHNGDTYNELADSLSVSYSRLI